MAQVAKSEHAKIRQLVEREGRKVPEVATLYGCTPATVYAIISKLRRKDPQPALMPDPPPAARRPVDLFQPPAAASPAPQPATIAVLAEAAEPAAPTNVTPIARQAAKGVGGKLAKPGFGLTMRTSDGEEQVSPFRSLEDLLSAIKPILRAAARNPEPAWFSVAPIDLALIDVDAA